MYVGFYATMETRLGVRAGKAWPPKGVLIDSALLSFFFISITCLVSACTWSHVPMFIGGVAIVVVVECRHFRISILFNVIERLEIDIRHYKEIIDLCSRLFKTIQKYSRT